MKNNILIVCITHEGNTSLSARVSDETISREDFLEEFLKDAISGSEDDDFDDSALFEGIMTNFDQMENGEHRSLTFSSSGERVDIDISRKDRGD